MNKPKPTMKQKLALTAETVRAISATNLGSVAGGMMARSYRQCQTEEINCQYTH
ncbi:MAG: hypothetical protein K8W52_18260 [Deltaproteobacteria bacterium]|nr:hypothetical protein [Deltaproteobacteria bacterium]